jgi:hypothetical protein
MLRGAADSLWECLKNKGKFLGIRVRQNSSERLVRNAIATGIFGILGSVWSAQTSHFGRNQNPLPYRFASPNSLSR